MDQDALILLNYFRRQLIKYTIDPLAKNCTSQVLDTGYSPSSVSCSQSGQVFVTEKILGKEGLVSVRIYNINTGHREVWNTNITSQSRWVYVSFNANFIVISSYNVTYVYNKDRVLLYSVTHDQVSGVFWQTYITETGVFWRTLSFKSKLLIMNLRTKDTKVSTEGIERASDVSGTSNGYVYVTYLNEAEVGVFLADGTFMHLLHIDLLGRGRLPVFSAALALSNNEDLIAFTSTKGLTNSQNALLVYRAHR